VAWLKDRGFAVALNIMGASSTDPGLLARIAPAYRAPLDALVLADSCGSLTPDDTGELVRRVRARQPQVLGIHLHDNLGLALPNALAAIERGVEIVDSTVAGMGRGAGNLRTEQLLLTLCMKYGRQDLDPTPLLHVLSKHMMPLHRVYGWGSDFAYMLSGLAGIHPTYCQELKSSTRYRLDEVAQILEDLPRDKRARFDATELIAAEARHAARKHRGAERAR
jgi:4-hydroxy 2-oxovalerate aldolase